MVISWYVGENSAASDRPRPNLKQRVAVIDSSQRETLYARNYAGEGPPGSSNGALVLHDNWLLF
jgi:hypothetical protein